ncbi:MAG: CDGSH iron-sulfur domain-containing protein [Rickettsiales bacterium]|nr:CDGSH iron-sulfur domain-containing protein [Rickettsiales bacterium]
MNTPIKFDVKKGQLYSWCSCGLSQTDPLCDGSHKGHHTELRSLKYTASETKSVYLCTCKKTKTPPFCDGSHRS